MKKIVLAVLVLLLNAATARSAEPYLEEVKALGIVSGQGLACGASKFDTFEMLARAILITKASSDRQQAEVGFITKPKPMLIFPNRWMVFSNVRRLTAGSTTS